MKTRWILVSLLLAFSVAFAFFQREARLGEKHSAGPALMVPAPSTPVIASAPTEQPTPASDLRPIDPTGPIPENPVELANGSFNATAKPALLSGNFTRENDALVYDADARLRLANDLTLSSPTGVMVSDEQQKIFAGDMAVETARNTIVAHEAVLDTTSGQMTATVASISFTNDRNQLIRMTGENVTLELPATHPDQPTTILSETVNVETLSNASAPSSTTTE